MQNAQTLGFDGYVLRRVWMVVRFVCVFRVLVCAQVCHKSQFTRPLHPLFSSLCLLRLTRAALPGPTLALVG